MTRDAGSANDDLLLKVSPPRVPRHLVSRPVRMYTRRDTCRYLVQTCRALRERIDAPPEGDGLRAAWCSRPKELEVLDLPAPNASNNEIGRAIQVGETTIKWPMKNHLLPMLDAGTRGEVIVCARSCGLIQPAA